MCYPTGPQSCSVRFDWWVDAHLACDTAFIHDSLAGSHQAQPDLMHALLPALVCVGAQLDAAAAALLCTTLRSPHCVRESQALQACLQVQLEDEDLCRQVQKGLASPGYGVGRLVLPLHPCCRLPGLVKSSAYPGHFHDALTGAASGRALCVAQVRARCGAAHAPLSPAAPCRLQACSP